MNKYTFSRNQLTASLFIRSTHGTEIMFAVAADIWWDIDGNFSHS